MPRSAFSLVREELESEQCANRFVFQPSIDECVSIDQARFLFVEFAQHHIGDRFRSLIHQLSDIRVRRVLVILFETFQDSFEFFLRQIVVSVYDR